HAALRRRDRAGDRAAGRRLLGSGDAGDGGDGLPRTFLSTLRARQRDGRVARSRDRAGVVRLSTVDSVEPAEAGTRRGRGESCVAELRAHGIPAQLSRRVAVWVLE